MSQAFHEGLDTATLLLFRCPRDARAIRASIAWHWIEIYMTGARQQGERIAEGLAEFERRAQAGESVAELRPLHAQVFCDVHFFFICCYRIAAMIEVVRADSGVTLDIPGGHTRWLNHYRAARHALEHIDDRLPGSSHKEARRMAAREDLGNVRGETFTFGGKEWDVGRGAIAQLQETVHALEEQIREALVGSGS